MVGKPDPNMDVRVEHLDEMFRLVWAGTKEIIIDADTDKPVDEGGYGRRKPALIAAEVVRAQYDVEVTYED